MWNCPVCSRPSDTPFCPGCGFDRSADPESFPTLSPLKDHPRSAAGLRRERSALVVCPGCGGTAFSLEQETGLARCRVCGRVHQAAPAKKTITAIAAGDAHTVALYSDGTVRAVGKNNIGQCVTGAWKDIVAISTGFQSTIGLRADGTAVAVGNNYDNKSMVHTLRNIHSVIGSTGGHFLVLHNSGTVTSLGRNDYGERNGIALWKDVQGISAGAAHSIGWTAHGKIYTAGNEEYLNTVSAWSGISSIVSGTWHVLGLKADGTAVAAGRNNEHQCEVQNWTNLIQLCGGAYFTAGLRRDGTVCIASDHVNYLIAEGWTDITAIAAGKTHLVGLRADGALVAVGTNDDGQCDVDKLWL